MTFKLGKFGASVALLLIWVALVVFFGILKSSFLTVSNLTTLANEIPARTALALGMTFVLIIGGIDLSVGSVLAFAGSVLGVALVQWHLPLAAAVLLCFVVGLAAGSLNGSISVFLNIPSFIVTLAMLEIARGLAFFTTSSTTIYIGNVVEPLARPLPHLRLSPAFLIAIAAIVVGQIALSRTIFGRYLVAIGTNEQAVRLAGINTRPWKIAVFALSGLLAGLAALFDTSRLGCADPNGAGGFELSAIAAVVIGGTSLMGGRGSVINTFFGVLIIQTLEGGLAQISASESAKRIVTGLVILGPVIVDAWRHHLAGSKFNIFRRLFS